MLDEDLILGDDWDFLIEDIGVTIFPDRYNSDLSVGEVVYDSDSNRGYTVTNIVGNKVYLKELY